MIADAHKFVLDFQAAPAARFDMIFMDVNYEEANVQLSPPRKFLDTKFLQKLMVCLAHCKYFLGNDYPRRLRHLQPPNL